MKGKESPGRVRVCMVAATFSPRIGGAQVQTQRLAVQLKKQGHEVWILTRRLKGTPPSEEVEGIEVVRVFTLGRGFLATLLFFFSALFVLIRRRKAFDIIHVHMMYSQAVLGAAAGILLRKPALVKNGLGGDLGELQSAMRTPLGRLKLAFLKRTLRAFVSISQDIREEFLRLGFPLSRLAVIPNGVDAWTFRSPPRGGTCVTVLFTGRFIPEKGIATLLNTFCSLEPLHPFLRLSLVGNGPLWEEVLQRVKTRGLENRVSLPGEVKDPSRYYWEADIFVLLSCREGLSNALLEAMACGLPIIASRASGMRDAVEEGRNGFLIPFGDEEALKEKLDLLCTRADLRKRMGRESRRIAVERFSMERVGRMYEELYFHLLAGNRRVSEPAVQEAK